MEEERNLMNLMEILVTNKYNEVKGALGACQCPRCRLDILSYVLNRLPPKYVVTDRGAALSKVQGMSLQFDSDVLRELVNAAEIVKKHPRHQS